MDLNVPFIRVVIVSFDGGQMTIDCIESLLRSDWPSERWQLVMVDNGSLDDVTTRVRDSYPTVRILEPLRNLGFAGGCNLGMRSSLSSAGHKLLDFDYVALVNNDATVDPGWLKALVEAGELGKDIGAVSAKMLFADRFTGCEIELLGQSHGGGADHPMGVRLSDVRINDIRSDNRLQFDEGFYRQPNVNLEREEEVVRWCDGKGALRIAVDSLGESYEQEISFSLSADKERIVKIKSDIDEVEVLVTNSLGDKRMTPTQVTIGVGNDVFDVVNNVGSNLYDAGFSGDRGFLERDCGQYEQAEEVFGWCGGAVLLKKTYLDDVGMFDERFFLYYEDTDLSWRGRLQGWRYLYAPAALVRHHHAQSSVVGSETFRFHTERNRLLVLAKNAPAKLVLRSGLGELKRTLLINIHHLIIHPLTLRTPLRAEAAMRRRVLASYTSLLPAMLRDRFMMDRHVSRKSLMKWMLTK